MPAVGRGGGLGQAARRLGRRSSRCTPASSSRWRRSSSTASSSTGPCSATRCGPSATTPTRPATAASPSRAATWRRWRSAAPSPAWPARATCSGWEFHIVTNDIAVSQVGFIGIAVALLGRNSAVGIAFAALLFGGLQVGTSPRALDPSVFPPQLAGNLAIIIQGLIILFVGAQLLLVYAWRARRAPAGRAAADADDAHRADGRHDGARPHPARRPGRRHPRDRRRPDRASSWPSRRSRCRPRRCPSCSGLAALACAIWALTRDERKLGLWTLFVAIVATAFAIWVQDKNDTSTSLVVNSGLFAATLVYATPLAYAALGGIFSRALGGREHRPRGHDADRRLLRDLGHGLERPLGGRPGRGDGRGGRRRAGARGVLDPSAGRSDRHRHGDQLPRTRHHRLRVHRHLRLERHAAVDRLGPERQPARRRRRSPASAASSARST